MEILIFILIFIVGAFGAAMGGDFSGVKAIAEIILCIVLLCLAAWIGSISTILLVAIAAGGLLYIWLKDRGRDGKENNDKKETY